MNFLEYSGIVLWSIIALYALIAVRLWWIKAKHEVNEFDRECDEFIDSIDDWLEQNLSKRNKTEEKNT